MAGCHARYAAPVFIARSLSRVLCSAWGVCFAFITDRRVVLGVQRSGVLPIQALEDEHEPFDERDVRRLGLG